MEELDDEDTNTFQRRKEAFETKRGEARQNAKAAIAHHRKLRHVNIALLYLAVEEQAFTHSGAHEAIFFSYMQLCDLGSLSTFFKHHARTFDLCQAIIKQSFDGICYMHSQGICHLDIKPGNLGLALVGGDVRVQLLDIGCSSSVKDMIHIYTGDENILASSMFRQTTTRFVARPQFDYEALCFVG